MKTHIIKFGDGCTLIVTLIDRNGQVIRPSVLKTLAVSLARGATTASNIGFTLNANGTKLTNAAYPWAAGMVQHGKIAPRGLGNHQGGTIRKGILVFR